MAYLDLNADFSMGTRALPVVERLLGAQERLVVMLSRRDPLWSLEPRRFGSRVLAYLFGIDAPHKLADKKLETLRRYAVTYRVGYATLVDVEQAALAAGYRPHELAQVRSLLDA